ncbi:nitroreductase family protein [Candidatus Contubernalis alkaliaceticus]|uniref:nitroreductase family protein n=1 Tax=Candidatus Contubernalis alkaliaceticus TaxID=338645 RepID=UPI001F4BED52|nr:nitroreductase family protein [Candidatus Contubernalis alkalaceticus]UNC91935.1 nitroreductase family protein [Candidatus Contubernalis alkalaceticus]
MIRELVLQNRSIRRFKEEFLIESETLRELVDLARLTPSARNMQPLKYILSSDPKTNSIIFSALGWAGYLKDWNGPEKGERPSAYIIILGDKNVTDNYWCDHGITAQTILLGAVEKGLAGCMIGTIDREILYEGLSIPKDYDILLVLALGKPAEQIVLEEKNKNGDIKYWRDDQGIHHVPKRPLEELIVKAY